jgi:N12 class adenine-specific DNA methylase
MTRIAGLPNADSQRAFDMFVKVRDLLGRGGRFMGLTGTPIANTLAEAFTLQRYFSYDQLEDMGLSHFDSWAQMFADAVMMPEMTPDGSGFRVNTRLARFTNIPELSAMLSQFMIMRRWNEVSGQVERPLLYGGKPTPIRMPGSKQLKDYVKSLARRAERVRSGQVDPKDDNMLKIVGDGRKAALDLRMVLPNISDLPLSKINTAAWSIAEIYHRTRERKSAQLVFCDLGTPKPHKDSVVVKVQPPC